MSIGVIYVLAALGAYRAVCRIVFIAHWFWKTRNDKPTPWLGGPRGTVRGIHP